MHIWTHGSLNKSSLVEGLSYG